MLRLYRSVVDPGGGDVVTGGIIEVFGPQGGGAAPSIVIVLGISQILYNGKTIQLIRPPSRIHIDPFVPRTVNVTLTGITETLMRPRVQVMIRATFAPVNSQSSRVQCDNFWQWAQHGQGFRVICDSAKTLTTTLNGAGALGATSVIVNNSTGITVGNTYALVGGPYYQLVIVTDVSGTTITFANNALDFTFPSGSVFRDWLSWDGIIQDQDARAPIQDLAGDKLPLGGFDWTLEFCEATP